MREVERKTRIMELVARIRTKQISTVRQAYAYLQLECGLSRRTAQDYLMALVDGKYILVTFEGGLELGECVPCPAE